MTLRGADGLATIAQPFVDMAHRIVWCTVATTGTDGRPHTRVLHPIWEWDGTTLTGSRIDAPVGAAGEAERHPRAAHQGSQRTEGFQAAS